jgi:hypothetical protein
LYFYALCRSGTEEDYSELSQLLEDISTYRRDCIEAKQIEKERKLKKEEADRKQAEHIRNSALGNLGSKTVFIIQCICYLNFDWPTDNSQFSRTINQSKLR